MAKKEGKGKTLTEAIEDAAKQVGGDLGTYTVATIQIDVGNPKIDQYKVTISK